jgi:hypothetical protein
MRAVHQDSMVAIMRSPTKCGLWAPGLDEASRDEASHQLSTHFWIGAGALYFSENYLWAAHELGQKISRAKLYYKFKFFGPWAIYVGLSFLRVYVARLQFSGNLVQESPLNDFINAIIIDSRIISVNCTSWDKNYEIVSFSFQSYNCPYLD